MEKDKKKKKKKIKINGARIFAIVLLIIMVGSMIAGLIFA